MNISKNEICVHALNVILRAHEVAHVLLCLMEAELKSNHCFCQSLLSQTSNHAEIFLMNIYLEIINEIINNYYILK